MRNANVRNGLNSCMYIHIHTPPPEMVRADNSPFTVYFQIGLFFYLCIAILILTVFFSLDIDECDPEKPLHQCAQNCENIPGSYKCLCQKGFELSKDGYDCQGTT